MKKLFVLVFFAFIGYAFVVNQDFRGNLIDEARNVKEKLENEFNNDSPNSLVNNNEVSENLTPKKSNSNNYSDKTKKYFNEICYGSEFSGRSKITKKWKKDLKIYVEGNKKSFLITELNTIVRELNSIIDPIDITIVDSKSKANYIIYFCSGSEYASVEPAAKGRTNNNWGMFFVSSRNGEIFSGTMYVDVYRCKTYSSQKHLLREELTQSLGLMNDSYSYSNSIFYQGWTETTSYAPIDIEIIEMLYN